MAHLNNSLTKDVGNPRGEYMDQMKRKQRYTALDAAILEGKMFKGHRKGSNKADQSNSFSGTYYHNNNNLV